MRRRAALLALPLLILLAACGEDDDEAVRQPGTTEDEGSEDEGSEESEESEDEESETEESETEESETEESETEESEDEESESEGDGESVSASEYATSVCDSFTVFVTDVQTIAEDFGSTSAGLSDPEDIKGALVDFLGAAVAQADTLVEDVEGAGEPDTDQGPDVAAEIEDTTVRLRDRLVEAEAEAAALDASDPQAFAAGATELGTSIQEDLTGLALSRGSDAELDAAFDDEPACRSLAAQGAELTESEAAGA